MWNTFEPHCVARSNVFSGVPMLRLQWREDDVCEGSDQSWLLKHAVPLDWPLGLTLCLGVSSQSLLSPCPVNITLKHCEEGGYGLWRHLTLRRMPRGAGSWECLPWARQVCKICDKVFITSGNWRNTSTLFPTTAQSRIQHQFQLLTIIVSL